MDPWQFAAEPTLEGDVLLIGFQWDDGRLRSGGRLGFRNVAGQVECVSASFGEVVGLDGTAMKRVQWGHLINAAKRKIVPWLQALNPQAGTGSGRDMVVALAWLEEKPNSVPVLNRTPAQGAHMRQLLAGTPPPAPPEPEPKRGRPRLRDQELQALAERHERLAIEDPRNPTARLIAEIQQERGKADAPSEKTIRAHLGEAYRRGLLPKRSPGKPWSQNG